MTIRRTLSLKPAVSGRLWWDETSSRDPLVRAPFQSRRYTPDWASDTFCLALLHSSRPEEPTKTRDAPIESRHTCRLFRGLQNHSPSSSSSSFSHPSPGLCSRYNGSNLAQSDVVSGYQTRVYRQRCVC